MMTLGFWNRFTMICISLSPRRMSIVCSCFDRAISMCKGIGLSLLLLWTASMKADAEMPETVITPQTNQYGGCSFDVRFDHTLSTNLCWVVVFVSSHQGVAMADDLYLQLWDKQGLLSAFKVSESQQIEVPDSLIKKAEKGRYFVLKFNKEILKYSWGAIRLNDEHICVIRFRDWLVPVGHGGGRTVSEHVSTFDK